MTNTAIILVADPRKSLEYYVGMPLLKRTILSAQRGGINKFIIIDAGAEEKLRTLLVGDERINSTVHWSASGGSLDQFVKGLARPVLIIKAETVFDSDLIKNMLRLELDDAVAYVAVRREAKEAGQYNIKLNGNNVIECNAQSLHRTDRDQIGLSDNDTTDAKTAGLILASPSAAKNIPITCTDTDTGFYKIIKDLLNTGKVEAFDVTNELCVEITSRETANESKKKMYEILALSTDSPFAVHVNRKLSRLISGALVRLPITPNQITLLSFFVGLAACWFFLQGGYWYSVLGALTLYVSIILDLADGEVARLKFMYSRYGALLDSVCDSIVHSGIMLCIALAIHRDAHTPNILLVGLIATGAMFICSHLDFYLHFMEKDLSKGQPSPLTRLFANEDYFYLSLLGFTVFDGLTWYLWAVAAGSVVYLFVLTGKLVLIKSSVREATT